MKTVNRSSGLRVTAPDSVEVSTPVTPTMKKTTRAAARMDGTAPSNEVENILRALQKREYKVVDRVEFKGGPDVATASRKRGVQAAKSNVVRLEVPLQPSESAVLLVERDGMYTWQIASAGQDVVPTKDTRRGGTKAPPKSRSAVFEIELHRDAGRSSPGSKRRDVLSFVWGKVRTYVLKFVADIVIREGVKYQERDVRRGYVDMSGADPTRWPLLDDLDALQWPKDRPPRILLFVHGTFSSTIGGFAALAVTPWGQAFLAAARTHYDAIVGFDHPTLSVDPLENATAMLAGLKARKWAQTPQIDVIAHSRGGLVIRSLLEKLLPGSGLKLDVGSVVFVGCTNQGTLLAEPDNWKDLVDLYTNLTAGLCRILELFPQTKVAAKVLDEVIACIGSFVKLLVVEATKGKDAPGIAAMDPTGAFVRDINGQQPGQPTPEGSNYFVVESNFESKLVGNDDPPEFSKRFKQMLADGFIDRLMENADNDLVVNTSSMGAIDVDVGKYIKDTYDFGTNPHVYHTNYFTRPETANALARWLTLPPPATKAKQTRRAIGVVTPALPPWRGSVEWPGLHGSIVPASVDTDFLVVDAGDRWRAIRDAINKSAPSYVVVKREYQNQMLNYAFRAEELLDLKNKNQTASLQYAMSLRESDASRQVQRAVGMQVLAPATTGLPTRNRQVVYAGDAILGVIPERVALSQAIEMASVAKQVLQPRSALDRVMKTRTLPTFTRDPLATAKAFPMGPSLRGGPFPTAAAPRGGRAATGSLSRMAPRGRSSRGGGGGGMMSMGGAGPAYAPKKQSGKRKAATPAKKAPVKKSAGGKLRKSPGHSSPTKRVTRSTPRTHIKKSAKPRVRKAALPRKSATPKSPPRKASRNPLDTRPPTVKRKRSPAVAELPKSTRTAAVNVHATMDESVVVNTLAKVDVTVSRDAIKKALGATAAGDSAVVELDRKILVKVVPKINFSMSRDESGVEIDVPEPAKPEALSFEVKATDLGDGEVWVTFRQGGVQLALLKLHPTIVKRLPKTLKKLDSKGVTIGAPALAQPLNQLVIEERTNGDKTAYSFEFTSEALKIRNWSSSKSVEGDRASYVANLYKRIEDRWVSAGRDVENFAAELRAYGKELFDELIPPKLQKVLWENRDKIESIQVISTEPFIPWELVHLCDPDEKGLPDETRFLGQLGLIRWIQGAGKHDWPVDAIRIRPKMAFYVAPDYPDPDYVLAAVKGESAYLKRKFSATALEAESGKVRAFISRPGRFDLLHFACHGDADSEDIGDAALLMTGRMEKDPGGGTQYIKDGFTATVAGAHCNIEAKDNSPMVVLNACRAGRMGYKLTSIGGFAQAFLKGGAGAFVGALWSVGDQPASTFTEKMYDTLLEHKTLAEATIAARAAAQKAKDATWLAYVVYGHPHMRISR